MLILFYHFAIFILGYFLSKYILKERVSKLLRMILSLSFGLLYSLPITYLIAVILKNSADPTQYSVSSFTIGAFIFFWLKRKDLKNMLHNVQKDITNVAKTSSPNLKKNILEKSLDPGLTIFAFGVSYYLMTKTFKLVSDGSILVARNTVFDFGHGLSIIRSMSWGNNLPYSSPFVAGTEHLYHYMFHFWIAILEHHGLPINLSVNIPSSIGFTLFLLTLFILGKEWFGKKAVGVIAVVFSILHGGLMFIPFINKYGANFWSIWRNPNYLFTGPFDGSLYSLFLTLNVFVNQRQLGISLALFFLIYFLFSKLINVNKLDTKKIIFFGTLLGMLTLWHLVLTVGLLFVISFILITRTRWKELCIFLLSAIIVALPFIFTWIPYLLRAGGEIFTGGLGNSGAPSVTSSSEFWLLEFIVLNFGVSIVFFVYGVWKERNKFSIVLPIFILVGLFILLSIPAGIVDQKFLNLLLVLISLFTASGILRTWQQRRIGKIIVITIFPLLILSGFIDLMVIKNDYMFPIPQSKYGELISWIDKHTQKDAIFVTYQEIFDPVTLAGRKNFLGFFKQPAIFLTKRDQTRGDMVRNVFDMGDSESLRFAVQDTNADYILVSKKEKPDFPFSINYSLLKATFPTVLDTPDYLILKTL